MITAKQKEWLLSLPEDPKDYPPEFKLYHRRIQNQINKNIEMALWLAKNKPDVLLNEVVGIVKMDEPRHKRFQDLILLVQILKPQYYIYAELSKVINSL